MRALAISTAERWPALPDLPTVNEAGHDPAFKAKVAATGAVTVGGTVDEARRFVKDEAVRWREVVLKSGAKAD